MVSRLKVTKPPLVKVVQLLLNKPVLLLQLISHQLHNHNSTLHHEPNINQQLPNHKLLHSQLFTHQIFPLSQLSHTDHLSLIMPLSRLNKLPKLPLLPVLRPKLKLKPKLLPPPVLNKLPNTKPNKLPPLVLLPLTKPLPLLLLPLVHNHHMPDHKHPNFRLIALPLPNDSQPLLLFSHDHSHKLFHPLLDSKIHQSNPPPGVHQSLTRNFSPTTLVFKVKTDSVSQYSQFL